MFRGSRIAFCTVDDVAGGVTRAHYRPRFRPRKLVMPIDPEKIYSEKRFDPATQYKRGMNMLKKGAQRDSAIKLGAVPEERMVGEEFRLCLDACKSRGWLSPAQLQPQPWVDFLARHPRLKATRTLFGNGGAESGNSNSSSSTVGWTIGATSEDDVAAAAASTAADSAMSTSTVLSLALSDERGKEVSAATYTLWSLLERTPLTAPVHGPLALKGRSVVEAAISSELATLFPRLRSHHVRQTIQHLDSFLTSIRFAVAIGFADRCDIARDLGIFREITALKLKARRASLELNAHRERMAAGIAQNELYYWRKQFSRVKSALQRLPAEEEDVLPRVVWTRDMMHAFIGFVEQAEGPATARQLARRVFLPAVASHSEYRAAVSALETLLSSAEKGEITSRELLAALPDAKAALRKLTSEEFKMGPAADVHPINARSDQWRLRLHSSANYLSAVDYVEGFVEEEVRRHQHAAPALLVKLLGLDHAFREAQVVLKYSPEVPTSLRDAPLDFERSVVHGTVVQEADQTRRKVIDNDQPFKTTTYTEMKFIAGDKVLGIGRASTDIAAMNAAARHFLVNYYFTHPNVRPTTYRIVADSTDADADGPQAAPASDQQQLDVSQRRRQWSPKDYFHSRAEKSPIEPSVAAAPSAVANPTPSVDDAADLILGALSLGDERAAPAAPDPSGSDRSADDIFF